MRRAIIAVIAVAVAGTFTAACGSSPVASPSDVDISKGQQLFVTNCGGCHALANANTKGTIGPNLDAAYQQPAQDGWDRTSFQALVLQQIDWGSEHSNPPMPADLVTGEDAQDVAAYVAAVAARDTSG